MGMLLAYELALQGVRPVVLERLPEPTLQSKAGTAVTLGLVTAEQVAAVFDAVWGEVAARTWNRHRSALRSFTTWVVGRSWATADLTALIERRPETRDRTRVIDRQIIAALLDRRDVSREKTLWRLAFESAARADEVLALGIEDLDLDNKRGRVLGKGGTVRWIHWQSGTGPPAAPPHRRPHQRAAVPGRPAPRLGPHACGRRPVLAHRPRPAVVRARRVPVQAGHPEARPPPASVAFGDC
ncbi:hypothetical protein ACQP1W_30540 [Spirillospora sp. CA-255316]